MMGIGSYGHGGSSPSSSNLSALAPPFTVDRSNPKTMSFPLVDLTESHFGVPLNSSLHNWLPSHSPNTRPDYFSKPSSEFDSMPSSNAMRYSGLQAIESSSTHLPPVKPVATASTDAFLYDQCSNGVATGLVEAKPYYPTYVSAAIHDQNPLAVPDQTSYDWLSNSHGASLNGSSHKDYTLSGLDYAAHWSTPWDRLGDWEHGQQVELEGSFCSKGSSVGGSSIYQNYMNQAAHASKGLKTCEDASHALDMMNWENYTGCVSTEQLDDKSFSKQNSIFMPVDYSKTSLLGSPSILPENHSEAPSLKVVTNSRNCQVPTSTSYEKHMRHHDATLNDNTSFVKSSPVLVIRPPVVDTSFSAPKKGPFNVGTDAADPDHCGNNPSNVNKSCPLLSSEGKVRFDTSQLSIHLGRNDHIYVESFSAKNEELSNNKKNSEDSLDQIFKAKSGLQIPHLSPDGFNLGLDIEALNPVGNSSEGLDHYNPAVDSPCWKGAPVTCFSPFEASNAVSSQYLKQPESSNGSSFQVPHFFTLNIDDTGKICSQNPNEKPMNHEFGSLENGLASSPKRPSVANLLFREYTSDDAVKAGSYLLKSSCGYEVQYPDNSHEPGKDHVLPSNSKGESNFKPSLIMLQNLEAGKMTSETNHSSETGVADAGSNTDDSSKYGSSPVPFHATKRALYYQSSVENASAKLSSEGDSTPKLDFKMLVNTMTNLSELLLFHSSNNTFELKEGDREALTDVIYNLQLCISRNVEQTSPTQNSLLPQQGTSQYRGELPKLHKEVSMDRSRLTKEAAVNTQNQLDRQFLHEEKQHHIVSGKKIEKISDSISVQGDADMVKEEKMTQAIMKVLSENFNDEEEIQSQSLLYKNLWLEAEAALCSNNYKARYNRMKMEMEKSELHKAKDVSENTMDVEKKLRSKDSHDLNTDNKLAPEARGGPSSDISIQNSPFISKTCHADDVMARFGILKSRIDYSNSGTDVEELSSSKVCPDLNKVDKLAPEATEAKCLTQDISIRDSPIIGTTCHADDVMARFHILKCQVDNSNSIKSTDVEETSSSNVSLDLNMIDKLACEATEEMGSPIAVIPIQFHDSPTLSKSCNADDVESSIMSRFHILKSREDKLSSMDVERQQLPEVVHLEFSGNRNHWPINRDGSEDGRAYTTVKESQPHPHEDHPLIQSRWFNMGNQLPAGWYDSTSSDWEHVMKEELTGQNC